MNCQEGMDLMQRYLDRDLEMTEISMLMEHMKLCKDCASMFDKLRQLSVELESLPKVSPPFSIVDAIMPQLEMIDFVHHNELSDIQAIPAAGTPAFPVRKPAQAHDLQQERGKRRFLNRFSYPAIGGVVAAAVLIGVVAFHLLPNNEVKDADEMLMSTASLNRESGDAAQDQVSSNQAADDDSATQMNNANTTETTDQDAEAPSDSSKVADRSDQDSSDNNYGSSADPTTDNPVASRDTDPAAAKQVPIIQHPNSQESAKPTDETKATDRDNLLVQDSSGNSGNSDNSDNSQSSGNSVKSGATGVEQGLIAPSTTGNGLVAPNKGEDNNVKEDSGKERITEDAEPQPASAEIVQTPAKAVEGLLSKDGAYTAVVENHQLIIKSTADGLPVAVLGRVWQPDDQIESINWSSDSKTLHYQVKTATGTTVKLKLDTVTGEETTTE